MLGKNGRNGLWWTGSPNMGNEGEEISIRYLKGHKDTDEKRKIDIKIKIP